MTYAPPDLLAVQRYARDKTGQGWASLGIIHSTPQGGGYHEGHDLLHAAGTAPEDPGSDYSYTESSRDRAGLTEAASAFDFGGEFKRFLEFNAWIVGRARAGDPRCRDIREIIHTPDGRTVRRWDALGVRSSGDNSHLSHTHFSFFRDSLGRRDRDDNFLGLLKEFFDGAKPAPQGDDDEMNLAEKYRLKIMFENWDPTREQWIEAGGTPEWWDAAAKEGGARNGVKQALVSLQAGVNDLSKKLATPPPAQVTLTPAQLAQVTAQLKAELAPLIALARKLG